ncbi:MAG TPA: hypothetical protein VGQ06_16295 [Gemmatimonadales bacterium]|nr:hypothetical protein [Gemmatimonadales bacterium]
MEAEAILALVVLLLAGVGSLSWTPLGRALIERLRRPATPPEEGLSREVLDELQQLRREVAELSERMDFTERLLAQPRDAALPKPRS